MAEKTKNQVVTAVSILFFLTICIWIWVKKPVDYSDSERRELAQLPELSWDTAISGELMEEFDSYSVDQLPMRDAFHSLKAFFVFDVLRQRDNNGIYLKDGYASKLEYPIQESSLDRAADRFSYLYDKYLAGTESRVYFSIIPDKNYFLAAESGYPALDYDLLMDRMKEKTEFMTYIDLTETLTLQNYYRTDTHWRQETLIPAAKKLAAGMDVELTGEYEVKTLDQPFYGVYCGQAALPIEPDTLAYLTNEILETCVVYDYENDRTCPVYDMEKAYGKDPYEMFLSGSLPLVTITNPVAETDRELILFRDSFGSSMAPLLVSGYRKITLVDIRYLHPDLLERYIEFDGQDVLFLYSTLVLNHSETLK